VQHKHANCNVQFFQWMLNTKINWKISTKLELKMLKICQCLGVRYYVIIYTAAIKYI